MNRTRMGLTVLSLVVVLVAAACGPTAAPQDAQPEARVSPTVSPDGTSGSPVSPTGASDATSEAGVSPVATPESTRGGGEASSPLATPAEGPLAYQRVEIPEAGMALDVPSNWQRLDPDWTWSPDSAGEVRVGLNWGDLQPPMEPEAVLLPKYSQILSSEPLELGWASARRVTLEVYGRPPEEGQEKLPVASVQTHVLVVISEGGVRQAYDFYAAAPTAEALATLEPVLEEMVHTAELQ